ncbi:hypothetical protein BJY01DRAFT_190786 [Aspergillus pseudoustus]|uniref:Zn(2)-C6 fungal-type domain-containing protein n=1 Tax=Aspergillus pseudoustus TaxID=1810923 RepID=A0ABR4JV77_9EURO
MVNPGHPSRGCKTCKLRKIKCDLGRPACRHCARSGRVCLGYGYDDGEGKIPHYGNCSPMTPDRGSERQSANPPEEDGNDSLDIETTSLLECLLMDASALDTSPGTQLKSFDNVALSAMSTIRRCLRSLRQTEQSLRDRRALLADYGKTTGQMRETLIAAYSSPVESWHTPAVASGAFLFSLYEMIVATDPSDKTWRVHLDGLVDILSHQATNHYQQYPARTEDSRTLYHALVIFKCGKYPFQQLATYNVSTRTKAFIILDLAILLLQPLASQVSRLHCEIGTEQQTKTQTPRKLDVQKLRAEIKSLEKNLRFFPKVCPPAELDVDRVPPHKKLSNALLLIRWNDYHALQLVVTDLLLSMGRFIHPASNNGHYEQTREHLNLSRTAHDAARGICSTVPALLKTETMRTPTTSNPPHLHTPPPLDLAEPTLPVTGLWVLWPLCCALNVPAISQTQRGWIQETLWFIGTKAWIPCASALANSKRENTDWSDVLAGLLFTRVGISQEMREVFGQLGVVAG